MLMPSHGWRDAVIPPGLKNRNRLKGRSLKTVLQEVAPPRKLTGLYDGTRMSTFEQSSRA